MRAAGATLATAPRAGLRNEDVLRDVEQFLYREARLLGMERMVPGMCSFASASLARSFSVRTVARSTARPCGATSSTFRRTTTQPLSLLSIARLNIARSRVRPSICSLLRIDQTSLGRVAASTLSFALDPGFAARSLGDQIFRMSHGRAPLLQRMTSLYHRLSGPEGAAAPLRLCLVLQV